MTICRTPGCTRPVASTYAVHCDRHKHHARRHGHPEQTAVTVHELKPYRARVRARAQKNADNPTWSILAERWNELVLAARETERERLSGKPYHRHEMEAAHEIIKLAQAVEGQEIIETVAAMYLMQEDRPYRFKSDDAFRTQLVRRVRGLTLTNAGEYFDHRSGKVKRVYRDAKSGTVAALARYLSVTFGGAGLHVARLEATETEAEAKERAHLHAALAALR
jgi:hypothetical protein